MMSIEKKKKMLFLIGIEQNQETFNKKFNKENIIFLQCYQPLISQPFDDLMRDILIAVYQENVEKIVVVASKKDQKRKRATLAEMLGNKGLQQKIQTLDYLFKNAMPEFASGNIKEWLETAGSLKDRVKNTVNLIQHHPLMPANVKVKELWVDQELENQLEIEVS
jgi:carbonic anhydrase